MNSCMLYVFVNSLKFALIVVGLKKKSPRFTCSPILAMLIYSLSIFSSGTFSVDGLGSWLFIVASIYWNIVSTYMMVRMGVCMAMRLFVCVCGCILVENGNFFDLCCEQTLNNETNNWKGSVWEVDGEWKRSSQQKYTTTVAATPANATSHFQKS